MKKNLKLTLASLSFAAIVSGALLVSSPSFAEDAPAESAAQVVELKNGSKVQVEGDSVSVVNQDGTLTPAPDGTHEAADGKTITTKDGKIVN
jgi:hypothetical protein